ncbi:hypothetical protein K504DRAFT_473184 [Pleomassaria siparia CBS 279.74]|uniref:SWI/SNF family DNA-dependent ATPase Ris1 n=1 Tax=Pleomassaria siparia CBS 279.74 TaxID=1314801 RepID=A0A6G1KMF9_9PLEO|nr:hypothetical protein K504DRAFT_473184 [Pleomassaria siparia CBS 279.74]
MLNKDTQEDAYGPSDSYGTGPAYPVFPQSPVGDSTGSPALLRKRSLASMEHHDMSDSKRISLHPSPALTPRTSGTPRTPTSLSQSEHATFGPKFNSRGGDTAFGQNGNGNARRCQHVIDLTTLDDAQQEQNNAATDPFPELASAYRKDDWLAGPLNSFNQDYMTEQHLAQFLIHPTQPGRGYAFDLFGDYDGPDPVCEAHPEALNKLIENIKPHDDLPPEERQQTPRAMSSQLMEHQKLGLTWLIQMEEGSSKGSILADEMGLGKTVQALALILARPSTDRACKTTLIIAPVALMKQWEKELQRHVKVSHRLSVFIYHGSGKKAAFNKLRKYDVVLTTFGTLGSEKKQMESRKEAELVEREQRDPTFVRNAKDELALIGKNSMWYRIIIDEAQCIKNKSTQVSKASNELMARHRLCMTGTPMMNSIDELYPLIRFLQIKPYNDPARFSDHFSKPFKNSKTDWRSQQILGRLQILLKSIMLRREKTSLVDGKQICTIPPKVIKLENVEFSDDERQLYDVIEKGARLQFNGYLKKGTVNNNYANVLVLLLRLRQACCHPHLIKDLGVQVSTEGIPEDDLLSRARLIAEPEVRRLRDADGFECPICLEADLNPTIIVACGHTCCGECFQKLIDPTRAIREGNEEATAARCPHCRGTLSASNITDYKHFCKVFCPDRLEEADRLEEQDAETDSDADSDSDSDSDDSDEVNDDGDLNDFVVPDDADDDYEAPSPNTNEDKPDKIKSKKGVKSRAPGKKKDKVTLAQLKKESLRNKSAKKKYLRRLRKSYVSSGKINKTVEILSQIDANHPAEKTLIFSQFTSLLDLVEVPLMDNHVKYQRYDGSMKMDERADAVNKFMDEATEKVMLISLKAGNAGLNLSKASHVIILDPFWNPFIEDQAVDRAHRMPQEREVHVHRLLVPETVEDRICALQDKKRELINAALDEKAGKSLSRLSVQDLKFLFGMSGPRSQAPR